MTDVTDIYDDEPGETADEAGAEQYGEVGEDETALQRPRWKRALKGVAIAALVLVLAGLLLYNFGGMMPPSADAQSQYAQLQAAGAVQPVQERFHIPIPGCVCHSDNPVLQVEHQYRSMNQCASCHGSGGVAAVR